MKRALVLSLLLLGCGGGGSNNFGVSIGASGGGLTEPDGSGVVIPAGALTADTTITASATASPAKPTGTTIVGPAYTFGPEGEQFAQPVTVTLAITSSELPTGKSAADVSIYTAPAGSSSYTQLTTTVVDSTHVSAQVSHFSVFVGSVSDSGTHCVFSTDCLSGICLSTGVCA